MSPTPELLRSLAAAAGAPLAVGPKAAALARLGQAGLPVPEGVCLTVAAYRRQLAAAGVEARAVGVTRAEPGGRRHLERAIRLCLFEAPLDPAIVEAVARAHAALVRAPGTLLAVRSSALCEDGPGASFAGQFETILGVSALDEVVTAVRACWASLWSTRAGRYMEVQGVNPARTAMAVLVQRLVSARASGGVLSRTPEGRVLVSAAWGLGPAVAQGEVVPDRYLVDRNGRLLAVEPGRKDRQVTASVEAGARWRPVAPAAMTSPCLDEAEASALARLALRAEGALGTSLEAEWALDDTGFQILQARPLGVTAGPRPRAPRPGDTGLSGQPAGAGRASGPARVIASEADLFRVRLGDVLVTRVPGPALAMVLPRVAAVVAELGGCTSHLAALARDRGIPAVLGAADASARIPEGVLVHVDGVTGEVRWSHAGP